MNPPVAILPAGQAAPPAPTQGEHLALNAWVVGGLAAGTVALLWLAWWVRDDQRRRGVLR